MHDLLLLIRLHVRVITHVVRGFLLLIKAVWLRSSHIFVRRNVLMKAVAVLLLMLLLHLGVLLIHFASEVVTCRGREAFGAFFAEMSLQKRNVKE